MAGKEKTKNDIWHRLRQRGTQPMTHQENDRLGQLARSLLTTSRTGQGTDTPLRNGLRADS